MLFRGRCHYPGRDWECWLRQGSNRRTAYRDCAVARWISSSARGRIDAAKTARAHEPELRSTRCTRRLDRGIDTAFILVSVHDPTAAALLERRVGYDTTRFRTRSERFTVAQAPWLGPWRCCRSPSWGRSPPGCGASSGAKARPCRQSADAARHPRRSHDRLASAALAAGVADDLRPDGAAAARAISTIRRRSRRRCRRPPLTPPEPGHLTRGRPTARSTIWRGRRWGAPGRGSGATCRWRTRRGSRSAAMLSPEPAHRQPRVDDARTSFSRPRRSTSSPPPGSSS